ncbi:MAG: CHASE2 domain-containing protein [Candidatus Angelobacter sp.]
MKIFSNPKNTRPITWGRWTRLNLALLGLVFLVNLSFPVATLSQKLNDFFFRLRHPLPISRDVAMVLIDDATLTQQGRWPWPRTQLAKLIRAVSQQQPRAIGLDVLLPEVEDEQNDADLTRAIQSAPNLVLASKISTSPTGKLWLDPWPRFVQAAKGVGHVQAIIDFDGLCRAIPVDEPSADGLRPAFALELASLVRPSLAGPAPVASESSFDIRNPGVERVATRPPLLIDYRHQFEPGQPNPPFEVVSAGDLLAGKNAPQLAGKVVLIGFGAIDVSDRLITPVSNQLPMPGVEINANVTDMLLSGRSLRQVGSISQFMLMVLMSMAALWVVVRYPGVRGLLLLAGMLAAVYAATFFLFLDLHRLLSYGPLLIAGVLAAPIAQLENLLIVDREVTSRLQQLRQAITPHYGDLKPARRGTETAGSLYWKLAALRELQAELSSLYSFNQTLLETMREGLAVYGADGSLRFSNETWKKFCERQHAFLDELSSVAQLAGGWRELANLSAEAAAWSEMEVPLGEELWLFRAVRLPWTSFAEAGAVLLIAEDITAQRQRDQARSEALSFVTHELRTPLISIQGFSELLMRYPNSPATTEAPATIFRETNRLVAMINTYLEVLRLDAGARPLRLTRTNVRSMVEHVEKVVQPLAASAKVPVKVEMDCADKYLLCDETLISGALLNLVSNAIKYGSGGTGVTVRVCALEEEVQFEVQNSGPVIPEAELEQLFERFYRPARSESIPGWGLGLSFVRRISQQHGGRVKVSSNESSGTSFAFTLPRGACEVSEVAP